MTEIRQGRRVFRSLRMIKQHVKNFYNELYKQKIVPMINFHQGLVNKISEEDVESLEAFPTGEEIKKAV